MPTSASDRALITARQNASVTDIFEGLHTGLVIIDPRDHTIVRANPKFAQMVGLPAGQIEGRVCHEFVCPREVGRCPITDLGLSVHEAECALLDGHGREVPVLKSVTWLDGPDGPLLIENVTSIAPQKALEAELAAAAAEQQALAESARRASAAKNEFLANMSHEIRTPMNGMLGMVELLQGTALSAEQRQYVATIGQCGEQLLHLISDVLDLARLESGRLALQPVDLDLRAVLAEAVGILAARADARGLDVRADVAPDLPPVLRGDAGRLRQVVLNLLGNAIKFTDRGEVVVSARAVAWREDGVTVRVAVRDTGVGIAAEHLPGIFHSFCQVDASPTRRHGGSGLGLAICRQLVELMGGEVGVQSTPGAGSTFWFTVPLGLAGAAQVSLGDAGAALAGPPALRRDAAPFPPGVRVLVVEDNRINQVVALRLLEKTFGLHADAVENGAEALEALAARDYDVVLMDCHMPVLDGLEATRRLRRADAGVRDPGIPVIAMTANAVKGAREQCLAAGMDDYVPKPVDATVLRAALQRVLRRAEDGGLGSAGERVLQSA